jgi:excisionase family DNA binding protein
MTTRIVTEPMLKVSEVAMTLHVHPNTVRRWAESGILPSHRISVRGDRRFQPSNVNRFVEHMLASNGRPAGPSR